MFKNTQSTSLQWFYSFSLFWKINTITRLFDLTLAIKVKNNWCYLSQKQDGADGK